MNSKISYGYNLILQSNDLNNLPRTSTQSNLETLSSHNEDETLILQCSTTSSNDDDYQHDLNSTDNEESHPAQYQMIKPTPTFIYV